MDQAQFEKMRSGKGFVAALDQSGGSTPKALGQYGIMPDQWSSDEEMFGHMHAMRSRIMKAPEFTGSKVLGAILFERTMESEVDGQPVARFLWQNRQVVPFLKVDKGLAADENGVQLMQPMPDLDDLLKRAVAAGIFGTKMRSVINQDNAAGIDAVVAQQFDVGKQILSHGLVPIIEPEVNIKAADKAACEDHLRDALKNQLDALSPDQNVMLKLTLPERADHYRELVDHDRVVRVVALSGGYSREEANHRLSENHGMVASFSRALTEGLTAQMDDQAFNSAIGRAIDGIYQASLT